jgi:hypothetical protein
VTETGWPTKPEIHYYLVFCRKLLASVIGADSLVQATAFMCEASEEGIDWGKPSFCHHVLARTLKESKNSNSNLKPHSSNFYICQGKSDKIFYLH